MTGFIDQPVAAMSRDGTKLHLRHGPIDLIIAADGDSEEILAAFRQARKAFDTVLGDLVEELALLRKPVSVESRQPAGKVALRMHHAARRHSDQYVTPMVAVAGAVADHILDRMCAGRDLRRAFVNNGGDIAVHLAPGTTYDVSICSNPDRGTFAGKATIRAGDGIGGIATSGWRGRSHSLGIADAVTVLARDAATADAAATLIANEVDVLNSPHIARAPASSLAPDSDLGKRMVTVAVDGLTPMEIALALDSGYAAANRMVDRGEIAAAFICLDDEIRTIGDRSLVRSGGSELSNRPLRHLEDADA